CGQAAARRPGRSGCPGRVLDGPGPGRGRPGGRGRGDRAAGRTVPGGRAGADIEPDPGQTWTVDSTGTLVLLDHLGTALDSPVPGSRVPGLGPGLKAPCICRSGGLGRFHPGRSGGEGCAGPPRPPMLLVPPRPAAGRTSPVVTVTGTAASAYDGRTAR